MTQEELNKQIRLNADSIKNTFERIVSKGVEVRVQPAFQQVMVKDQNGNCLYIEFENDGTMNFATPIYRDGAEDLFISFGNILLFLKYNPTEKKRIEKEASQMWKNLIECNRQDYYNHQH